jgi:hypothetical protein
MADVYNPDTKELIPYAPRNLLKSLMKSQESFNKQSLTTQILFSFVLQKFGKNEKEQH